MYKGDQQYFNNHATIYFKEGGNVVKKS